MKRLFVVSFVLLSLVLGLVSAVQPFGAQTTFIDSERAPEDSAGNMSALAGNVTELNIFGYSITQSWQGYFGNVSGTIMLADSNDYVMYNWSLASPSGEVYATENNSIVWTNVQCFNFTAAGTYADDTANRGGTSAFGMNLSQLESMYGIAFDDVDGVNETFSLTGNPEHGTGYVHDLFYTNNLQFDAGECLSTHIYDDTGGPENQSFQEVILYDPDTRSVLWTAILDEEDNLGFDQNYHDFEMIVPEDGHGTDIAERTYYFYVELE